MEWTRKAILYTSIVFAGVVGTSFFTGYKYHEVNNPQKIVSLEDTASKRRCDELQKELEKKDLDYRILVIEKIDAETDSARAKQREAEARKDISLKPYELEKQKAELEAKVTRLEAQRSVYDSQGEASKAKYEAQLAQKDAAISGLNAQISVKDAREEWFKAQYETVIAKERNERAKLERKLIETGNDYRNVRN